jgi:glycosyltransferase involved in cell wall biosynthesis
MQKAGVDLLHSPNFLPPFYSEIPSVVTFHDLGFLRYPHTHHWLYARIYPAFAKKAVVKASRIIVPSKSTYDEIAYYYPQVKNKLRIIPEGADDCFKKITDNVVLDEVRLKYHLPDKFLLIVGTLEPRKNLERFFQAFKLYVSRNPNSDFRLFLCGKSWLRHKQFMQNLKNSSIQDKVTITGYVPNEDLVGVYNCAYALAFPSYYEGFGIPAVEAMRCGVPVLASNAFSLPEVLGDAGLYFNPFDIEEMASAIAKIANNSELRNELAERGWKRSEIFSWEKSAKMTEEVYLEILK